VPCGQPSAAAAPRHPACAPDHPPFVGLAQRQLRTQQSELGWHKTSWFSGKAAGLCSMKHQEALVLDALDWNKPHVGAGNRFADCGRVSGVVLGPPPHVRLCIGWRYQSHIVSKPLNLACPVVGGSAGLYADQAG
jgi:hypothetical protein